MSIDPEPPEMSHLADEAVVAGNLAAHAAESSGHDRPVHAHCQNCGTALNGPYCHHCGQHDFDFHRSFGHMFLEALENFLHFDAKFFRNIITLLFQPGKLSAEFNAGKRAAQMPPFRLYLFISVLFFFISLLGAEQALGDRSLINTHFSGELGGARPELTATTRALAEATPDPTARQRLDALAAQLADTTKPKFELSDEQVHDLPPELVKQIRRAMEAADTQKKKAHPPAATKAKADKGDDDALTRYLTEKGQFAYEHQAEIKEAFTHALPKILLFCLPFFALYARVLFRKTGYVYLQHFIVALHFHTFAYLWWLVLMGWSGLIGLGLPWLSGVVAFFAWLWMVAYPFLMMRRLFGQSWPRTILKTAVLSLVYAFTLWFAFLGTAILVFMLL